MGPPHNYSEKQDDECDGPSINLFDAARERERHYVGNQERDYLPIRRTGRVDPKLANL